MPLLGWAVLLELRAGRFNVEFKGALATEPGARRTRAACIAGSLVGCGRSPSTFYGRVTVASKFGLIFQSYPM